MSSGVPKTEIDRIASLCDRRWDRHYTRAKLRSDPVYAAVVGEIGSSHLPVLDIGCGIGLLAHYLSACGCQAPVTGLDYDERKIASAQRMARAAGHSGLAFTPGDVRTGLPEFSGHVVVLDILQFLTQAQQDAVLSAAAARVAPGGKLIIRTGLRDGSWRFGVTVLGDYLAKATLWMKAAPTCYPDAAQFHRVLGTAGMKVTLQPLWGRTPFNNFLVIATVSEAR